MWNVETKVILLLVGVTGTISESFRKYTSNIQEARNQGTRENSHIVHYTHTAESTDVKVQNNQHGN